MFLTTKYSKIERQDIVRQGKTTPFLIFPASEHI